ncbi:hypothetical protein KFK09_019578 [Dendrobium nobile]|uniref:CCHC-type domain-containing protein n=1 Tax=Dendrobium nobile TaxID=94219 RepID=A0A8T3ARI0_DENNO|nr:hypothetical protein KFK09_019578 [Dendrobium nobile]
MLSRYAPQIIPSTEEKCQRFLAGLHDAIRQPLIPFSFDDYPDLVGKARKIEIDFQATQKRRDFLQKKRGFEKTKSFQTHPNGPSVKKGRSDSSGSSFSSRACNKCGRTHRGECLSGSNVCYMCHQPGHMARNCPRGQREGRPNPPPQQSVGRQPAVGRPRAQESTASASELSHPVARPVVQPRVYAITQQEAKESPDVITGIIHVKYFPSRVLFDTGASHSFISQEFVMKHALDVCTMPTALSVLLPDGSRMSATLMCSTFLTICEKEFDVLLIVLPLLEFDVILGMDWMSNQFISIDCNKKVVKIKLLGGEKLVFQGDRGVSSMIISSMKACRLLLKGYPSTCKGHFQASARIEGDCCSERFS